MSKICQQKCISGKYGDSELSKGEGVCIDRCVAKYLELHERIGKRLQNATMQDQEAMQKIQGAEVKK